MRTGLLLLVAACTDAPTAGKPGAQRPSGVDTAQGDDDPGDDDTPSDTPLQPALPLVANAQDLDPADDVVHVRLTAAPATHSITDWRTGEVRTVEGYAYNGTVPGPTIRAKVGDTVIVDVENTLDVPTTVHWHGLDVPVEMDGVPWMRDPVGAGETHTYTFTVESPLTAWYHPHFDTVHQVDRGLYGVFVVEDPSEPAVDQDVVVVLDDWAETQGDAAYADAIHGAHGLEGWWTANGVVDPALPVVGGETLRLRLLNASNHGYVDLHMAGAELLARDQGLLPAREEVDGEVVGPGDRVELLVRPAESDLGLMDAPYSLNGGTVHGEPVARLSLPITEPAAPAGALGWAWSEEAPTADPGHTDIVWTFQGSIHGDDWMISGERFPDVTVPEVPLGEELIVEVRNLSATEHPFHQHGAHFEVLSIDGIAPPRRQVEDTVNIPLFGLARLRMVPTRPGDWMSHCHILPHADGGMMTVLRVTEG